MNTNIKSIVYSSSQKVDKNVKKSKLYGSLIKPIYDKVHISTRDRFKMKDLMERL